MATDYRKCPGVATFNTGSSVCVLDPGKIKAIILTIHGHKIPTEKQQKPLRRLVMQTVPEEYSLLKQLWNMLLPVEKRKLLLQDTALQKSQAILQK